MFVGMAFNDPSLMGSMMFAATLILAAMFFSSIYFSFRDSFILNGQDLQDNVLLTPDKPSEYLSETRATLTRVPRYPENKKMNFSSGIYRISQAIKWTGRALGGVWLIGLVFSGLSEKAGEGDLIPFVIAAVAFIAITETVAWILKGFSDN